MDIRGMMVAFSKSCISVAALPFFAEASCENDKMPDNAVCLTMKKAHYYRNGHSRLGLTGYGRFMDFDFGRSNTCSKSSFLVGDNGIEALCATNGTTKLLGRSGKIELYHMPDSRRLYKVKQIWGFKRMEVRIEDLAASVKSLSDRCEYMFAQRVSATESEIFAAIEIFMDDSGHSPTNIWSGENNDGKFAIGISLGYDRKFAEFKVTVQVESLRVRSGSVSKYEKGEDISVRSEKTASVEADNGCTRCGTACHVLPSGYVRSRSTAFDEKDESNVPETFSMLEHRNYSRIYMDSHIYGAGGTPVTFSDWECPKDEYKPAIYNIFRYLRYERNPKIGKEYYGRAFCRDETGIKSHAMFQFEPYRLPKVMIEGVDVGLLEMRVRPFKASHENSAADMHCFMAVFFNEGVFFMAVYSNINTGAVSVRFHELTEKGRFLTGHESTYPYLTREESKRQHYVWRKYFCQEPASNEKNGQRASREEKGRAKERDKTVMSDPDLEVSAGGL